MEFIEEVIIKNKKLSLALLDISKAGELNMYNTTFTACFGVRDNITKNTYRWFNMKSPSGTNFLFAFIDNSAGCIASSYGLLPCEILIDDYKYKGLLCTNVMTHPEYAGMGLFKEIGKYALNYMKGLGYQIAVGVPNDNAIRGHLSIGWTIQNEIKYYEVNLDNCKVDVNQNINYFICDIGSLNETAISNQLINNYNSYFARTTDWLKWRISKPYSEYITFQNSREKSSSYFILKKFIDKSNVIKFHIVDFSYDNLIDFEDMIKSAVVYSKLNGGNLLNIWNYIENTNEITILKKYGFDFNGISNPIIMYNIDGKQLPELKKFHITLFDNDVY